MTSLQKVKQILYEKRASLVVGYKDGSIKEYYQDRIKDIKDILEKNPENLKDTVVADKVIGKVAASTFAIAGVKEIYADTISELAIPILEKYSVCLQYREKVEYIQNKDKSGMCPMEAKFKEENNAEKIYQEMIK